MNISTEKSCLIADPLLGVIHVAVVSVISKIVKCYNFTDLFVGTSAVLPVDIT
jgi:hypothetical protein